jgi:sulfur relay (sulfurtransferase) DsrF/TusC family protein
MREPFDILCNNCGQSITLQAFQAFARCSNCQTPLKIEETEKRIEVMIITEAEFLTTNQTPIPINKKPIETNFELLKEYEKELIFLENEWTKKLGSFKINKNKKYILPRKKYSINVLITAIIILGYSFFIDKGEHYYFKTIGGVLFFTSGEELYKWWRYSLLLKDYEEEKERLETIIQQLKES